MVAGLGPRARLAGFRPPAFVEELAERPAFGIEEVAPEQLDDPCGALQIASSPVTECHARKASSRCMCGLERRVASLLGVSR